MSDKTFAVLIAAVIIVVVVQIAPIALGILAVVRQTSIDRNAKSYKLNRDKTVAVSQDYFYMPMSTCPKGVTVILCNPGRTATFGVYDGKDSQWLGWAAMPKLKD